MQDDYWFLKRTTWIDFLLFSNVDCAYNPRRVNEKLEICDACCSFSFHVLPVSTKVVVAVHLAFSKPGGQDDQVRLQSCHCFPFWFIENWLPSSLRKTRKFLFFPYCFLKVFRARTCVQFIRMECVHPYLLASPWRGTNPVFTVPFLFLSVVEFNPTVINHFPPFVERSY